MQNAVWSIEASSWQIIYLNKAAEMLFYREKKDLPDNSCEWLEAIHPDDRSRFTQSLSTVIEKGNLEADYRIVKPCGEVREVCCQSSLVRDENGTPSRIDNTIVDITKQIGDRKRAEQQLEQKTAELQAIFQAFPDLFFRMTPDGTILDYQIGSNHEYIYVPPAEFLGKRIPEIMPAGVAEEFQQAIIQLQQTKALTSIEYALPMSDGLEYYEGQLVPFGEAEIILIVRNITRRKKAEITLHQALLKAETSQRLLRTVIDATCDLIFVKDGNLRYILANNSFAAIFGKTPEELLGKDDIELGFPLEQIFGNPKKDIAGFRNDDLAALNGEIVHNLHDPVLFANGEIHIFDTQKLALRNAENEILGIVGFAHDVTDRKRAEIALQKTTHNLQQAQRIAHIGNWEFDLITGSVTWSDEVFRIFGLSPQENAPTLAELQELFHPEDRELHQQHIETAIATGDYQEITLRLIRPSGELRYVNSKGEVQKNEDGQVVGLFGTAIDITERKLAEEALKERELFLSTIYDGIEQVIFVIDVTEDGDFHLAAFNPAGERLSGIHAAEQYGKTPEEVFSENEAATIRQNLNNCLQAGKSTTNEEHFILQGEDVWLLTTFAPLRDEKGHIYRIIGTSNNISDRKKAEIELQAAQQRLEYLLSNSPIVIYTAAASSDWHTTFISNNLTSLTGYTPEQFLSDPSFWVNNVHPEDAPTILKEIEEIFACGSHAYEYRFRLSDGSYCWMYDKMTLISDSQGNPVEAIGSWMDITDRKQIELALASSEAKFRELARREALINRLSTQIRNSLELDTILETVVRSIQSLFQIDRCVFVWYRSQKTPPVWEICHEVKKSHLPSFIGAYPAEELEPLSQKLLNLEVLIVDDVETFCDPELRNLLQSWGHASAINWPIQTSSGDIGVVCCGHSSEKRPWSQSEIELLKAVCDQLAIAINQAELYTQAQKSAQLAEAKTQELEQILRQLQRTQSSLIQAEKMSSLGQLVAGVAHEINNPVSFIYGNLTPASEYIEDLLELLNLYQNYYPQPHPQIQELIEAIDLDYLLEDLPKLLGSITVGANRIKEIIKSLRTFSRLDEAELKAVELHENIDSTLTILNNRIRANSERPEIQIIKDYGKLPLVECYAGQLNQVFMNLLANAIDALETVENWKQRTTENPAGATNPCSPTIRIQTIANPAKNLVQIRIADNGIGMKPETVSKIFDPFYTTKPVGKGTGLGLSITYQIVVEKHGGKLRCLSEEGKGTEFIVELPLRKVN